MSLLELMGIAAGAIAAYMTIVWLISLALRDSSIVDVFWGLGFVMTTWIYFALTPGGFAARKWLICGLVTVWGLRLSLYILRRNWGKGEDFRYKKWREAAKGQWWWRSYFKVFLVQGALMWIISMPLLAAQLSPTPVRLTVLDAMAVLLWMVGFFFEAVGDWQMARFKADPANRGQVMRSGLWRYTRHPNYFGDATQWWGYGLLASAANGWWSLFSPLLMTFLLVRVSGVTMLEKDLVNRRPGYRDYVANTSAFVPWFPRKPSAGEEHER